MNWATYRTAIETWVLAQTGIMAQWRDQQGGWQGKPQVRLHLHNSRGVGVDHLRHATPAKVQSVRLTVSTATSSTAYVLTIDGVAYTYTSDSSATKTEIRDGLQALIGSLDATLTPVSTDALDIQFDDTAVGSLVTVGARLTLSLQRYADLLTTVSGDRLLTLTILVKSRDQGATHTATYYLEKLRTSLAKPSSLAILRAAGLAYSTAEEVIDLDGWTDDRLESMGSLDVHFNAVENEQDGVESTPFVETAEMSATLTADSGTDFGWQDEVFGD